MGTWRLNTESPAFVVSSGVGALKNKPGKGTFSLNYDWLAAQKLSFDNMPRSYFYSDSMNDLPLLEEVSNPVATNPDDRLRHEANKRNWPILDLFV